MAGGNPATGAAPPRVRSGDRRPFAVGLSLLIAVALCRLPGAAAPGQGPAGPQNQMPASGGSAAPSRSARARLSRLLRAMRPALASRRPFHRVDVPIRLRGGYALVWSGWGGKSTWSILDTGTGPTIWPNWLRLGGNNLGVSEMWWWMNGHGCKGEWVLIRNITFAGVRLRDVPTEALALPPPGAPRNPRDFAAGISNPIMGMDALSGLVLTIDYRRRLLTVRDSGYDVRRLRRNARSFVVAYSSRYPNPVQIRCRLNGRLAWMCVDTGCPYPIADFAWSVANLKKEMRLRGSPDPEAFRYVPWRIKNVALTFGSARIVIPTVGVSARPLGADFISGMGLFLHFRITLDLRRHLALFEPYPRRRGAAALPTYQ